MFFSYGGVVRGRGSFSASDMVLRADAFGAARGGYVTRRIPDPEVPPGVPLPPEP
jgi:hypothetical protein